MDRFCSTEPKTGAGPVNQYADRPLGPGDIPHSPNDAQSTVECLRRNLERECGRDAGASPALGRDRVCKRVFNFRLRGR